MQQPTQQKISLKKKAAQYLSIGTKPGKIPELDGIRALAILMVIFYHFITTYQDIYGSYHKRVFSEFFQRLMQNGWLGVDLFFVLSGFLIFHHLMKFQNNPDKFQSYGRYALKRVLRTFPLYYAIILVYVLIIAPAFTQQLSVADYVIHLVFLQDYLGADILAPLWSLATEEKFYLMAPFLLLLLNRISVARGVTLMILVMTTVVIYKSVIIFQSNEALSYGVYFLKYRAPFHYAVVSIGVGVVVAMLVQFKAHRYLPATAVLATLFLILSLVFIDFHHVNGHWYWTNIFHYLTVCLFGVIILVAVKYSGSVWLVFLRGRLLRVIAILSYALYLCHQAVLPWVFKLQKMWVTSEEPWIHATMFFLIYVGTFVLLSLVMHYLIEKPFLLIKDRLQ